MTSFPLDEGFMVDLMCWVSPFSLLKPSACFSVEKIADALLISTVFSQGLKDGEIHRLLGSEHWAGHGGSSIRVLATAMSAFLPPVVRAFVSASEHHSWFRQETCRFPFQSRVNRSDDSEVRNLLRCGLWPAQGASSEDAGRVQPLPCSNRTSGPSPGSSHV